MAEVTEVRRVALLAGQLQWATMEQLEFLNEQVMGVLAKTGYARVEMVFENGHFAFIFPAPGLRAPKPDHPTPGPSPSGRAPMERGER